MFRSRISRFFILGIACAAALGSAAVSLASSAYCVIERVALRVADYALDGMLALRQATAGVVAHLPRVERVRAKAHAESQVQRRRPQIESTWRMCPSC